MNADHLVKRLALVEPSPSVVWTYVHKYYGDDFFIDMIEEEYGISPHSHEKLQQQMLDTINSYQDLMQSRLKDLKDNYLLQIHHLRRDLQTQTEEVGRLNRQALTVGERMRGETEASLQAMFSEKEVILFNRYDAEKQELY